MQNVITRREALGIKMEYKTVRCLMQKKETVICWNERWESQLRSASASMGDHGCNTPTSVWFCHPHSRHLFCEASSRTRSSECLCCPHLCSSRSSGSHLLGHHFWCSLRGQRSNFLLFEKSDGLGTQTLLIYRFSCYKLCNWGFITDLKDLEPCCSTVKKQTKFCSGKMASNRRKKK